MLNARSPVPKRLWDTDADTGDEYTSFTTSVDDSVAVEGRYDVVAPNIRLFFSQEGTPTLHELADFLVKERRLGSSDEAVEVDGGYVCSVEVEVGKEFVEGLDLNSKCSLVDVVGVLRSSGFGEVVKGTKDDPPRWETKV